MKQFKIDLAGRDVIIETGELAKQAGGAVLVRYGDTVVLCTATTSKEPREGMDFLPLTVDYEEKLYSVGKIPGGFIKREGRPSEKAILASRLIDRAIRPLFPQGYRNDIQVIATVLSVDQDNSPEVAAFIGASAALCISEIPFAGPVAAVEMGMADDELVVNPDSKQTEEELLSLYVAGTKDAVMMVEAAANELSEETVLEAIGTGASEVARLCRFIEDIKEEIGKPKIEVPLYAVSEEMEKQIRDFAEEELKQAIHHEDKAEREKKMKEVENKVTEHFLVEYPDMIKDIKSVISDLEKEIVRESILHQGYRPDGRALDEVRTVTSKVAFLPRVHGSGLFTRGQTQILTVATLGPLGDVQILDGLGEEESKRYMHHYNFPPYSVGESRMLRGPGRRDIGHGALAERAILPMIPDEEEFPYALRLVSEVLESNGSSSMGSVCGSTLALMDAGVPIKAPVSGIAMGLVKDKDSDRYSVLTDIQGMEDALGDMDFKVAGTQKGITALQMDIKTHGVSAEILKEALEQAKEGREYILNKMLEAISEPREDLSQYAPRIITHQIDPDKIRDVIGPGGKTINKIISETGVKIDIEDDGRVLIAAVNTDDADKALRMIERLTQDVEVGKIYTGKVTRLMNFGAFVEVLPGKEGLVHISQLSEERVNKVEDVVNEGDEVIVKVTEIDKQGRVNLSRKEALKESSGEKEKK